MNFFTAKSKTPMELTLSFIFVLFFTYLAYNFFISYYYEFILFISSFFISHIFDMKLLNGYSYLDGINLVSLSTLQNISTHEISRVSIEFTQLDIDKIFTIFTKTPIILTFILLFSRGLKTALLASFFMIFIHTITTMLLMSDIMFFTSLTSLKLINYFQMFGISQTIVDSISFITLLFKAYMPTFVPLIVAYGLWEIESHSFKIKSIETKKETKVFFFSEYHKELI